MTDRQVICHCEIACRSGQRRHPGEFPILAGLLQDQGRETILSARTLTHGRLAIIEPLALGGAGDCGRTGA